MFHRKIHLLIFVSLLLPGIVACGDVATPTNAVTVLPKDCRLNVNEQLPLTLDGLVPPNAVITWEADGGSIVSAAPGLNAFFIAPPQPAIVTIHIVISSGTPGVEIPITRQCIVTSPDGSLPQPTPITEVLQPAVAAPMQEVQAAAPEPMVLNTQPTIIISEVMGNPSGDLEVKKWNEYVEYTTTATNLWMLPVGGLPTWAKQ